MVRLITKTFPIVGHSSTARSILYLKSVSLPAITVWFVVMTAYALAGYKNQQLEYFLEDNTVSCIAGQWELTCLNPVFQTLSTETRVQNTAQKYQEENV